jgi:CBS domain-containing protein/sporulation protein YlmC with PRC-barrel domain
VLRGGSPWLGRPVGYPLAQGMTHTVVHLSSLAGSPLLDSTGERLGRVEDVVARLDHGEGLPPVIGLKARIGGRGSFVPIDRVQRLDPAAARMATTKVDLAQFERRPGEVLLRGDLLDRSLINVQTARLVTAHEVELICDGGRWRVAGIDPSLRPRLRRLMPRRLRGNAREGAEFIAWSDLEPFVGHVPTSRLKLANRRLVRLHPAQIADLVEAASHEEGEEILGAVGQDKELEADVFEELDDEHQVEFLRERPDQEVANILARMAGDDAADLLLQLDQERRLPILGLMPAGAQHKLRTLLGHNPSTAGGLMNPDFLSLPESATVEEALARVRASEYGPQHASIVCLVDERGVLKGTATLAALVRAPGTSCVSRLGETPTPAVGTEADLPEVARLMADYNLIAMPVLDGEGRVVGVVAVDDVLELLVPEDWRRRAGLARA